MNHLLSYEHILRTLITSEALFAIQLLSRGHTIRRMKFAFGKSSKEIFLGQGLFIVYCFIFVAISHLMAALPEKSTFSD